VLLATIVPASTTEYLLAPLRQRRRPERKGTLSGTSMRRPLVRTTQCSRVRLVVGGFALVFGPRSRGRGI
jgi:hypothetical protein